MAGTALENILSGQLSGIALNSPSSLFYAPDLLCACGTGRKKNTRDLPLGFLIKATTALLIAAVEFQMMKQVGKLKPHIPVG